jgi:hypothetical protein
MKVKMTTKKFSFRKCSMSSHAKQKLRKFIPKGANKFIVLNCKPLHARCHSKL